MKVVMMGRYTLNEVYGGVAMHIDRLSRHISCVDDIELHIITFGNENKQFKKEDLYIHMLRCSFRSLLSTPIRIWLLKREILKIDPDIVHAQGTYNPFCTTAMLFRNKYPVILTVLGIVAKEIKYETAITRFIGELIAKPNERYVISKIPNIIVGTTSIKNLISNITNSKIYVLPDAGIDFEKIQETQPHLNEKPDIFLASRLVRVKGIDILIKAIPTVIKLIPNLSVYIAGSGPQESELRDLIKKLNLEEHVKLLGFISENEKYQYSVHVKLSIQKD